MHLKATGIRTSSGAEETCVIFSLRQVIERFHSCMIDRKLDAVWACISITADENSRDRRSVLEYTRVAQVKNLVIFSH